MDFRLLFSARDHLRIKHHAPGLLTLKVGPGILNVPGLSELTRPDRLPRGVRKVDVSVFTMSATIEYDPAVVDPGAVQELLTTPDPARGAELLAELDECLGIGLS